MAGRSRHAIATLVAKEAYVSLLMAWVHSIGEVQRQSSVAVDVLLLHCETSIPTLAAIQACAHTVNPQTRVSLVPSCMPHPSTNHTHFKRAVQLHTLHARFLNTFHWLTLFAHTEYASILFLDADTVVLRPLDELFFRFGERTPPPADPDEGEYRLITVACAMVETNEPCNTGAVLLQPDTAVAAHVAAAVEAVKRVGGFLLSDQNLFNLLFGVCRTLLPREYNFGRVKPGASIPAAVRVLHFQGKRSQNKPIDLTQGGKLRYNRSAPAWPVFRVFEAHLAPMEHCYSKLQAKRGLPALFPPADTPAREWHVVEHRGNFDALAKRALVRRRMRRRARVSAAGENVSLCAVPRRRNPTRASD